jgi:hypothetical protein
MVAKAMYCRVLKKNSRLRLRAGERTELQRKKQYRRTDHSRLSQPNHRALVWHCKENW